MPFRPLDSRPSSQLSPRSHRWPSGRSSVRSPLLAGLLALPIACLGGCANHSASETPPDPTQANYTESIRKSDVHFEMIWVPAGGFWIGKHEVTWDEYLLYCDFAESKKVPPGVDAVSKPSKPQEDVAPYDRGWGTGRRPAVGMSWNAAKKYCQWLSLNTGHAYRLPTEKEWLLALGKKAQEPIGKHAWYKKNSGFMTHEVGKKTPNEHGLYDMYGNLWEYCDNAWSTAQPKRAVLRGGAWSSRAGELKPTKRLGFDPDWILEDPNVPAGVWWVPDGGHLGMRVLRVPEDGDKKN